MNPNPRSRCFVAFAAVTLTAAHASAHCELLGPNGGENLVVGSVAQVSWTVIVEHDLVDWDLWYSTTSADGPWIVVALDLPPGDPQAGCKHTYDWVVPDEVDETVWMRVQQDNTGQDYEDASDAPFSIGPASCQGDIDGDGALGFADVLAVLSAWGPCPPEGACPEDVDGDGIVGFSDVLFLLAAWGPCGS